MYHGDENQLTETENLALYKKTLNYGIIAFAIANFVLSEFMVAFFNVLPLKTTLWFYILLFLVSVTLLYKAQQVTKIYFVAFLLSLFELQIIAIPLVYLYQNILTTHLMTRMAIIVLYLALLFSRVFRIRLNMMVEQLEKSQPYLSSGFIVANHKKRLKKSSEAFSAPRGKFYLIFDMALTLCLLVLTVSLYMKTTGFQEMSIAVIVMMLLSLLLARYIGLCLLFCYQIYTISKRIKKPILFVDSNDIRLDHVKEQDSNSTTDK